MADVNLSKVFAGKTGFKGWLKRVTYGGGAVVGAQVASAYACTRWNEHRVFKRISGPHCSDGSLLSSGGAARHFVARPDLMNRIGRLLRPGENLPSDAYYCVLGAPNSGKTHAVRLACQREGAGVIYMQVHVPAMFGSELAAAIDYHGGALDVLNVIGNNVARAVFATSGGGGGDANKDDTDKAIEALMKGATTYARRFHRPLVLVLDDVDRLAEKQAGLLEELQGHAKAWSNAGLVRVVFVLSDGAALSQMKRRSSFSRANVSGFVTVDDVGESEAREYLAGRGLSGDIAADVMRVAGGRIGLLSHLATSIADMRIAVEDALHSVVEAAADEFKVAGLLDSGPRRTGGMAAIEALLEAGGEELDEWCGISVTEWSRAVPDPAHQKALLQSRVFVRHYPRQEVMFGSRPTAIYAQQLAGEYRKQSGSNSSSSAAGTGGGRDSSARCSGGHRGSTFSSAEPGAKTSAKRSAAGSTFNGGSGSHVNRFSTCDSSSRGSAAAQTAVNFPTCPPLCSDRLQSSIIGDSTMLELDGSDCNSAAEAACAAAGRVGGSGSDLGSDLDKDSGNSELAAHLAGLNPEEGLATDEHTSGGESISREQRAERRLRSRD